MKGWILACGARLRGKVLEYLVLPLLACGLGFVVFALEYSRTGGLPNPGTSKGGLPPATGLAQPGVCPLPQPLRPRPYNGEPVALNSPAEITAGFRGEVHPLLHGRTKLELTAHWAPVGNGQHVSEMLAADESQYFQDLKVADKQHVYTERDFSAFLPETLTSVGQIWPLDPDKVVHLLRQFHPSPSMHLVSQGRRVGPDGAFAVLRAVSSSYLDVVFRIHTEFDVSPKTWTGSRKVEQMWYTPGYFSGHMIVNREKGTVEFFRLGLPTDKTLNVHLTVGRQGRTTLPRIDAHDIVRVDRMELLGGNNEEAAKATWEEMITSAAAEQRLQRVFYKFTEIHWVPFGQALAAARDGNKPLFVMVLWGALDDQSC